MAAIVFRSLVLAWSHRFLLGDCMTAIGIASAFLLFLGRLGDINDGAGRCLSAKSRLSESDGEGAGRLGGHGLAVRPISIDHRLDPRRA